MFKCDFHLLDGGKPQSFIDNPQIYIQPFAFILVQLTLRIATLRASIPDSLRLNTADSQHSQLPHSQVVPRPMNGLTKEGRLLRSAKTECAWDGMGDASVLTLNEWSRGGSARIVGGGGGRGVEEDLRQYSGGLHFGYSTPIQDAQHPLLHPPKLQPDAGVRRGMWNTKLKPKSLKMIGGVMRKTMDNEDGNETKKTGAICPILMVTLWTGMACRHTLSGWKTLAGWITTNTDNLASITTLLFPIEHLNGRRDSALGLNGSDELDLSIVLEQGRSSERGRERELNLAIGRRRMVNVARMECVWMGWELGRFVRVALWMGLYCDGALRDKSQVDPHRKSDPKSLQVNGGVMRKRVDNKVNTEDAMEQQNPGRPQDPPFPDKHLMAQRLIIPTGVARKDTGGIA
ncbi:hypothetical protein C8J56DRAFT_1026720 [Mycena floridula]|nr:hypothetical protein C8J56DRAFT_1026720 [Mycena floridula]